MSSLQNSPQKKALPLPEPPSLRQLIGPSFILLGLALGSGELLLWPYLTANHGLGLIWGGLLGITLQFILNTEVMRYTLAYGESVFVGFRRMSIFLTIWYILSTFIPWSLPGFSSASAQILVHLWPQLPQSGVVLGLLIITGLILSTGKTLYKTMERFQKTMIMIGLPFILILVALVTSTADWQELGQGLLGQGNGWQWFPPGVAIAAFLGAFAYSGAGGNLNLSQSYYIKEKGFGMGKYGGRITSLFAGGGQTQALDGQLFAQTPADKRRWRSWWRLVNIEHGLLFWLLGFVTIVMLAVLAKSLVYGHPVQSGISFLFVESTLLGERLGSWVGRLFLMIAAMMLFATQVGVLEASSRIISENVVLLAYRRGMKVNLSRWFYLALWGQLGLGALLYLGWIREPRLLLTFGAVLNAAAMMVSFGLVQLLNRRQLAPEYRAGWLRLGLSLLAIGFFGVLLVLSAQQLQLPK